MHMRSSQIKSNFGSYFPSFVKTGGVLLADESVKDFHDQEPSIVRLEVLAEDSASSTSLPFRLRSRRACSDTFGGSEKCGVCGLCIATFSGGMEAALTRDPSMATGIVEGDGKSVLQKKMTRAKIGTLRSRLFTP